jgi:hypothetical protein
MDIETNITTKNVNTTIKSKDNLFKNISASFFDLKTDEEKTIGFSLSSGSKIIYQKDKDGITVPLSELNSFIRFKKKNTNQEFTNYSNDTIPNHDIFIKLNNRFYDTNNNINSGKFTIQFNFKIYSSKFKENIYTTNEKTSAGLASKEDEAMLDAIIEVKYKNYLSKG